jgi:ankyrin repeat protein
MLCQLIFNILLVWKVINCITCPSNRFNKKEMRKLIATFLMVFACISLQAQYQVFKDLDNGVDNSLHEYIKAQNDLNAKYKDYTLLNKTIEMGRVDLAKELIEKGADVNLQTSLKSPLVFATKQGDMELVKLLIEKGARVDRSYEGDYSLADLARLRGNHELANYLSEEINKTLKRQGR